ncbi:NCL2 [Symbiodinium microadriaticum]|nr:NCL2 [Symbiodinium microadriaticum]
MPEDLLDLSPADQQRRLKMRALYFLALGTGLVLLFSDPMVDVLSEIGERTGVGSFSVSFVLAPLASNASELVASYKYALKKSRSSIAISLATLEGAACMNNTFGLGIFMALIYSQSLAWEYLAETLAILFVQICVGVMTMKKTHTMLDGLLILSLYPISLLMVNILEKMGWN